MKNKERWNKEVMIGPCYFHAINLILTLSHVLSYYGKIIIIYE